MSQIATTQWIRGHIHSSFPNWGDQWERWCPTAEEIRKHSGFSVANVGYANNQVVQQQHISYAPPVMHHTVLLWFNSFGANPNHEGANVEVFARIRIDGVLYTQSAPFVVNVPPGGSFHTGSRSITTPASNGSSVLNTIEVVVEGWGIDRTEVMSALMSNVHGEGCGNGVTISPQRVIPPNADLGLNISIYPW